MGALRSFIVSFLALTLSLWLLPGVQVNRGSESVATLAVVVLAVGAVLRPLLTRLTVLTGTVGLLVAGLLAQALILGIALNLVPTVRPFSLGEVFVASWAAAAAAAAVNWIFDTSSDEAFFGQVLGHAVRVTHRHGSTGPGLLIVQLDGVSEPLMRQAITSGAVPTVSEWLRSGSHVLRGWHTGLPATTPAGQSVLLHGDVTRGSLLPLVRQEARSPRCREPARRPGRHRGDFQRRSWPARRWRGQRVQPVLRRRTHARPHDERCADAVVGAWCRNVRRDAHGICTIGRAVRRADGD